jgi:hypothetical protein
MLRNNLLSPLAAFVGSVTLLSSSVLGLAAPANAAAGFNRMVDSPTKFQNIVNEFDAFVSVEGKKVADKIVGARRLDNNKLKLTFDANLTFYFINEGANFRNQLGLSSTGTTQLAPTILFNDISCTQESLKGCSYRWNRDANLAYGTPDGKPLQKGDYYDAGLFKAGTSFDFFLRQDGYNRKSANVWHTQTKDNSDGLQHLMAYEYKDFLVLAFEDQTNGGDKDYNDVVFVADIKRANVKSIPSAATPEPSQWAGIGLAIFLGWRLQRFQKSQSLNNPKDSH